MKRFRLFIALAAIGVAAPKSAATEAWPDGCMVLCWKQAMEVCPVVYDNDQSQCYLYYLGCYTACTTYNRS